MEIALKKFLVRGINKDNKPFEIPVYAESKEHAAMTSVSDLIKSINEVIECVE